MRLEFGMSYPEIAAEVRGRDARDGGARPGYLQFRHWACVPRPDAVADCSDRPSARVRMDTSLHAGPVMPSPDPRDLEIRSRVSPTTRRVDWRLLARLDARAADTGAGLHDCRAWRRPFRAVQVRAPLRENRRVLFRFAGLGRTGELGRGMGEVWRAHDPLLDQQGRVQDCAGSFTRAGAPVPARGRQLARVRHANVVGVYGAAVEQARRPVDGAGARRVAAGAGGRQGPPTGG